MECYSRWTTPIHNLPKSPPTVQAHLQDIADNKESFTQKISDCLSMYLFISCMAFATCMHIKV